MKNKYRNTMWEPVSGSLLKWLEAHKMNCRSAMYTHRKVDAIWAYWCGQGVLACKVLAYLKKKKHND